MGVQTLHLERVRCIESMALDVSPGVNLIVGPNGSGKTSILESVHLLSTGRSFRGQRAREVMMHGEDSFLVAASVDRRGLSANLCPDGVGNAVGDADPGPGTLPLGLHFVSGRSRLRFDGNEATSIAEFARALPLVLLTPDSQRLLTDGSALRRRLFDWSLFHVEHQYQALHARYRRTLEQRNATLKARASIDELASWTEELARHGEALQSARDLHLPALTNMLRDSVQRVCDAPVDIAFHRGWDNDQSMEQALNALEARDRARGFTQAGPHRADLVFSVDGQPARTVLSRGESKRFIVALVLGQAQHLLQHTGRRSIVLFDELAADLDAEARRTVLDALRALEAQCWITSVAESLALPAGSAADRVFELSRGACIDVR